MVTHHATNDTHYRGRFAPSPTGPLHFGSLVSALASYLDAKKHHGQWIVRLEDVDGSRCKTQYAEQILHTLHSYGLVSDELIRVQSQHSDQYEQYLLLLKKRHAVFACNCTRQSLADYHGQHPHVCHSTTDLAHSWRLHTSGQAYCCEDAIQGELLFENDLASNAPVLKRKDGYFSYQLAVVVDDHLQQITHLVRGADLIDTTAQQLYLYDLFGWQAPEMCHIPLITNHTGDKISKQNHAKAIQNGHLPTLLRALHYLRIDFSPGDEQANSIESALTYAIRHWQPSRLKGIKDLPLEQQDLHFL
ncbi:tRNA glutamyl-Q(34) synthetase GluQRS [Marinomonas sp. A79]|uniref:tRNA glutamyl-Q(34) synthetase GluQRS n=1 Tax=Marinomonas vulgaris TaxID=2823372 RepID=A0ABS5HBD4_9GAMM|nr:tRNA glutamyl-Q(34) synthetase GluQRS [Marinomonas vulgaris]MBR7888925.1 tRNA glutamyl-Q(34) synthetase GluQRS [Marinomonas vulgaris]